MDGSATLDTLNDFPANEQDLWEEEEVERCV